jgi:hypothetical protein
MHIGGRVSVSGLGLHSNDFILLHMCVVKTEKMSNILSRLQNNLYSVVPLLHEANILGGGKTSHVVLKYMSRSLSPTFYTVKEPKNRFQGTNSARLCSLAGPVRQPYSYSVPSPHRLFQNSSIDVESGWGVRSNAPPPPTPNLFPS